MSNSTSLALLRLLTTPRMLSPITHRPFYPNVAKKLQNAALLRGFKSPYWLTAAQIRRTMNGQIKTGEQPVQVSTFFEELISFEYLHKQEQERIMTLYPPYFTLGVGVLFKRHNWAICSAPQIISTLNPQSEMRKLYVSQEYVKAHLLRLRKKQGGIPVARVADLITLDLYNSDQLLNHRKGFPLRGLALNILGKRIPQPAHDILLTTGILRGYPSPFWMSAGDISKQHLKVLSGRENEAVMAPTMTGMAVPLQALKPVIRDSLGQKLAEHQGLQADQLGLFDPFFAPSFSSISLPLYYDTPGPVFLCTCAGWEKVRSRALLAALCEASSVVNMWVNLEEAIVHLTSDVLSCVGISSQNSALENQLLLLQTPSDFFDHYTNFINKNRNNHPGKSLRDYHNPVSYRENNNKNKKTVAPIAVDLSQATQRTFYNAMCTDKPHCCNLLSRPIAIASGNLLGPRLERYFRSVALAKQYVSPIWVTAASARMLGVEIRPEELGNFVRPHTDDDFYHKGYCGEIGDAGGGAHTTAGNDVFFNLNDMANAGEILERFPLAEERRKFHHVLYTKWVAVRGAQRLQRMGAHAEIHESGGKLWVSAEEAVLLGLVPKPDAKPFMMTEVSAKGGLGGRGAKGGSAFPKKARKWYNAMQTTDPVKAVGLSTYFVRP